MSLASTHSLLTQHFDSSEVAFAKIGEQIALLKEGIRALYAFQNTHTPTYRLPPEILTLIFEFVQLFATPPSDWIRVTHVSQRWRQVALNSPILWSRIVGTYPEKIVEASLNRSRAVPLSFTIHGPTSWDITWHMVPHLWRIRRISLKFDSNTPWDSLLPVLLPPAPLLEYLGVQIKGPSANSSGVAPMTISNGTFLGIAPRLRHLYLAGCPFDINLNASIFSNLTRLELCNPPRRLSTSDLFTFLRRLPLLTLLSLLNVLDIDSPPLSPEEGIITLRSLEALYILGSMFTLDFNILSWLSFPATATVYCHCNRQTQDIVTSLSNFMTVHNAARQGSLSVTRISLESAPESSTLHLKSKSGKNLVTLHVPREGGGPLHLSQTPEAAFFLSLLPLRSLTYFQTNCNIAIVHWTTVFGSLPNLAFISAGGEYGLNVISAMIVDCHSTPPAASSQQTEQLDSSSYLNVNPSKTWNPIFPNLTDVFIVEANPRYKLGLLLYVLRARMLTRRPFKRWLFRNLSIEENGEGVCTVGWMDRKYNVFLVDDSDDLGGREEL